MTGHEDPVEIDLGMQKTFEVELVVGALRDDGIELAVYGQREIPQSGNLSPQHVRVLVRPEDEARVRAEFTEAGFL